MPHLLPSPSWFRHKPRLLQHAESAISFKKLGTIHPSYQKTYDFRDEFINEHHQYYATCPTRENRIDIGIAGWLLPADALKLYELAYFANGDILELGSYQGLSTSILAKANEDSGGKKRIVSNDIAVEAIRGANKTLKDRGLLAHVEQWRGHATNLCQSFKETGRRFDFAFIDHDHAYQPVRDVCITLKDIMLPGGMCLFHDYNDTRNIQEDNTEYGIPQGVEDGLSKQYFEFYGIFGCTALFRRT